MIKNAFKMIMPEALLGFMERSRALKRQEAITRKNTETVRRLLKAGKPVKLELGAESSRGIEGWTYIDWNDNCDLKLDLTRPIPFPDSTVDSIYSSHVLEHFYYCDLVSLLKECLRILKPGGSFSASVPNARIYIEAYFNPNGFDPRTFCRYEPAFNYNSKIDYLNYMAYMDGHHRYMFDEENLVTVLYKAGFRNVRLREFDPVLDTKQRDFQSIYVKAEK